VTNLLQRLVKLLEPSTEQLEEEVVAVVEILFHYYVESI
jgi:hypothetical protein